MPNVASDINKINKDNLIKKQKNEELLSNCKRKPGELS